MLSGELIAEKPWEMRGEIKSLERPENSLLEITAQVERWVHSSGVFHDSAVRCGALHVLHALYNYCTDLPNWLHSRIHRMSMCASQYFYYTAYVFDMSHFDDYVSMTSHSTHLPQGF